MWYPIARNTILEAHPWGFATERVQLALLANNPGWTKYRYALPSQCLRVIGIYPQSDDLRFWPYEKQFEVARADDGSTVIDTDVEAAWSRCIMVVENPTQQPPIFTDALAWLLASYLAGPVMRGDTGVQVANAMYKIHVTVLAQAKQADANQRQHKRVYAPAGLRARY